MKKHLIIFSVLIGLVVGIIGCEPFIENKIVVKNDSASKVTLILASTPYEILPGEYKTIPDIRKGSFEYSTIYTVPDGVTDYKAQGDISGTMVFNAGTEIFLVYTSVTSAESYTLYGVLTSSDDVNRTDPFEEETN
jgi:hypothetical protein